LGAVARRGSLSAAGVESGFGACRLPWPVLAFHGTRIQTLAGTSISFI